MRRTFKGRHRPGGRSDGRQGTARRACRGAQRSRQQLRSAHRRHPAGTTRSSARRRPTRSTPARRQRLDPRTRRRDEINGKRRRTASRAGAGDDQSYGGGGPDCDVGRPRRRTGSSADRATTSSTRSPTTTSWTCSTAAPGQDVAWLNQMERGLYRVRDCEVVKIVVPTAGAARRGGRGLAVSKPPGDSHSDCPLAFRATVVPATVAGVRFVAAGFASGAVSPASPAAATVTGTPRGRPPHRNAASRRRSTAARATTRSRASPAPTFLGRARARHGRRRRAATTASPPTATAPRDRIRCGAGRDIVTAERNDVVPRDCEVVSPTDLERPHDDPDRSARDAGGARHVRLRLDHRLGVSGRSRLRAVARSPSASPRRPTTGTTWKAGLLPGVTDSSPQPGVGRAGERPVDRVRRGPRHVARGDARHLPSERAPSTSTSTAPPTGCTWSAARRRCHRAGTGDLDKEWITCDNGAASPFRGHCYLSYFHVGSGEIRTTTSTDGGADLERSRSRARRCRRDGVDFNGAQPLVLPNGTLVVVYTASSAGDDQLR